VCDHPATRAHSWYTRRLADLPWQGLAVCLRLRTRRWFCDNPDCARRIFTERLPTIALPRAQRTRRLATIILVFGVAVGGAPGARLLAELGIAVSGDTLRRAVGTAALPDVGTPRVLGVDDWSLKKGRTYGTILVDLEAHRPVDLLPDRSAASLEAWLNAHPGAEIICRDRGGSYADGARQGAPDAVQVADRWHLFANLGDMLERLLARHHTALGQVRLVPAALPESPTATAAAPDPGDRIPSAAPPGSPTRAARERERRDARREARYAEIHALHHQGLGIRAVARHLGINKRTVQKYLTAPSCPHPGPRPNRRPAIAPYLPYLRARWDAGERRVDTLWVEIRARGFPGAAPRVREALAPWRREERAACQVIGGMAPPSPPPRPVGKRCAPRQVAAWLVRPVDDLQPAQRAYLDALVALCPAFDTVWALARDFARLLRERDANSWRCGSSRRSPAT